MNEPLLPSTMFSMGKSVLHEGFAQRLSALSPSFHHLLPVCVGDFVTTHACPVSCGYYLIRSLPEEPMA